MDELLRTYSWFAKAIPEPTSKNTHVQIGVHFEEVTEMIHELDSVDAMTQLLLRTAEQAMTLLADHLKTTDNVLQIKNRVEFLDSLCDQVVTATGSGYMLNMSVPSGMKEVNDSNWSKFIDGSPVFNENGKIIKGPDYFKPNLSKFV